MNQNLKVIVNQIDNYRANALPSDMDGHPFKALIAENDDIVNVINSKGIFELSEGKGLERVGLHPGELVGMSVFDVYRDHPEHIEAIKKALMGQKTTVNSLMHAQSFKTTMSPRFAKDGSVQDIVCWSFNLTLHRNMELTASELRKRMFLSLDFIGAGYWEYCLRDGSTWSSDSLDRILGTLDPLATWTKENLMNLVYVDDKELVSEVIDKALSNDNFDIKFRVIRANDAAMRWVSVKGALVYDPAGQPLNVACTILDVTEKLEAEQKLMEAKNRLYHTIEAAGLCTWDWDMTQDDVIVNEQFARSLGYDLENLGPFSYQRLKDLMHPNDLPAVEMAIQDLNEGRTDLYRSEFRLKNEDGAWVWFLAQGSFVKRDLDGKPCRMLGIQTDITERKRTNEWLERMFIAAKLSTNSVLITDASYRIEWANQTFTKISGYTLEESIGKRPYEFLQGPDTDEVHKQLLKEAIANGESLKTEILNYHKNGSETWIELCVDPVRDSNNELTHFVVVHNDIAERKKVELQLRKSNEILEQKVIDRTKAILKAHDDIEAKNRELLDSINYAQRIQLSVIPSIKEMSLVFGDVCLVYEPKDIVSGDFYWYHKNEDHRLIAVGDCTGHGVPGALISMLGIDKLDSIVKGRQINRPDVVLEELDKATMHLLKRENASISSNDGIDISLVKIHASPQVIEFASARSYGVLVSNSQIIQLESSKYEIGGYNMSKDKTFPIHRLSYQSGDRLYLFTDGFQDQFGGPDNRKFLRKNLNKLFLETQHLSIKQQEHRLQEQFLAWKGDQPQIDDVTIVGIEL